MCKTTAMKDIQKSPGCAEEPETKHRSLFCNPGNTWDVDLGEEAHHGFTSSLLLQSKEGKLICRLSLGPLFHWTHLVLLKLSTSYHQY